MLALTYLEFSGGIPAKTLKIGETNLLKVNVADVGNPGKIAIGVPSMKARHKGLPGFNDTP